MKKKHTMKDTIAEVRKVRVDREFQKQITGIDLKDSEVHFQRIEQIIKRSEGPRTASKAILEYIAEQLDYGGFGY